jgi:hypothetical protein
MEEEEFALSVTSKIKPQQSAIINQIRARAVRL